MSAFRLPLLGLAVFVLVPQSFAATPAIRQILLSPIGRHLISNTGFSTVYREVMGLPSSIAPRLAPDQHQITQFLNRIARHDSVVDSVVMEARLARTHSRYLRFARAGYGELPVLQGIARQELRTFREAGGRLQFVRNHPVPGRFSAVRDRFISAMTSNPYPQQAVIRRLDAYYAELEIWEIALRQQLVSTGNPIVTEAVGRPLIRYWDAAARDVKHLVELTRKVPSMGGEEGIARAIQYWRRFQALSESPAYRKGKIFRKYDDGPLLSSRALAALDEARSGLVLSR